MQKYKWCNRRNRSSWKPECKVFTRSYSNGGFRKRKKQVYFRQELSIVYDMEASKISNKINTLQSHLVCRYLKNLKLYATNQATNINAYHFCDIFFRHTAVLPEKTELKTKKLATSGSTRIIYCIFSKG